LPYTDIDGKRYFYHGDPRGKGLPLIFIHGSGGNHNHWLLQFTEPGDIANPLAVDLPGHGRSEGAPSNSVAVYCNWIRDFARSLGLTDIILAGHSLGGAIAMDYALQYPEDLVGLVLVGTGGRLRVAPAILDTLRAGQHPAGMAEFAYGPLTSADLLKQAKREMTSVAPEVFLADFTACDQFDIMERLSQVTIPALIICGTEDRLTPPKYSHFLKQKLPQAELVEIKDAGHMVMLEAPGELNKALTRFVKKLITF